ncbi:type III secretion system export apparatus subunit SctT [Roseateles amylovorans]|uniref:Type III secretion system export apparatus subunit SctT n=1 Tax=Roseateles amylovorans TaxID=2978473 RepID=A0ABY6B2T1_9BURK|nr:type III secretion system export apparatus subunit SctT [Roseateles amylovorans]UXH79529.1 type III secretion system export apparatus subunit SctT [Roseateles amylovorans]
MPFTSPDLILLAQALGLALARVVGLILFVPFLTRQQTNGLIRSAICLAWSLPTAWALWPTLVDHPISMPLTVAYALKEAVLGALLGMLVATPFWAVRGMGTLIDNQRGANAAQQVNPSLQADATLLGELSERALVALLIQWGMLQTMWSVLIDSYSAWSIMQLLPDLGPAARESILQALAGSVTDALLLAAPALLLLLLIELALAITSTAVQGFDVYSSAMAVKTLMALLILMLTAPSVFQHAGENALGWWSEGLRDALGLRR